MVGFHKYLLKNCFNFFSLNLTGTDEMQYKKKKKQERSPKCHMESAKEIFSTAGSEDGTKLLSLRLLRAHSSHKYLWSSHAVPDTVLGS